MWLGLGIPDCLALLSICFVYVVLLSVFPISGECDVFPISGECDVVLGCSRPLFCKFSRLIVLPVKLGSVVRELCFQCFQGTQEILHLVPVTNP